MKNKQIFLLGIIIFGLILSGSDCKKEELPSSPETIGALEVEKIVEDARKYVNAPYQWFYRNNPTDKESTKRGIGVIYSYGNKDDIFLFKIKLDKSPNAAKWNEYKYKTGLFKSEYDAGVNPREYWAGIDCSGLVQTCASPYTRLPGLSDQYTTEPYYVEGEIACSGLGNERYAKWILSGNKNDADWAAFLIGDLVLYSGHSAIVSQTGYGASTIKVINALGWDNPKTIETERKVIEIPLNYEGLPIDFNVYRFYKKQ